MSCTAVRNFYKIFLIVNLYIFSENSQPTSDSQISRIKDRLKNFVMAALRLSLGSSKQIAKVLRGNFRVSACFKHQVTNIFNKKILLWISLSLMVLICHNPICCCKLKLINFNPFYDLFKSQEICETSFQEPSYLSIQQRNDVRCQWNPITVFSRGFKTSAALGKINNFHMAVYILNNNTFCT